MKKSPYEKIASNSFVKAAIGGIILGMLTIGAVNQGIFDEPGAYFSLVVSCGNGICDDNEDSTICAKDCMICGDGFCDKGEDCAKDCEYCGDGYCQTGEAEWCPEDCAFCGNAVCEYGENEMTCAQDCTLCGDDVCEGNENRANCPEDC